MNELDNPVLSRLTNEIHFFNEQGIKVSIEVGKRLEEAKPEFLSSDEWMDWANRQFGYKKSQAYKLVAISKRFHSSGNSIEKQSINELYALTAFDDEELETPVSLPSGEVKKPIDMSQAEIEKYKKQLKETERERVRLENESVHYRQLLNQERSKPSQVVTKEVPVIPEGTKKKLEDLEFQNTNLRHGYQEAKAKIQQYEMANTIDFDAEQSRKQREKLQHEADYNTLELRVHITNFLEKAAISSFMQGAITASDPITKRKLQESITMLESFTTQIKAALNGRILGGIVNE